MAIAFTAVAVISIKEAKYTLMLISAILSAVFYYVLVFSFFRFIDARTATELIDIIDFSDSYRGRVTVSEISEAMGWRPESTARFIERCRRKGYFR